ncbi:hypothetical protein FG386_000413 [Cryptosporidium ryanae]|uniref:uncharacterized protein n=1 Tax=Cryptosporidium ryanae TaxID=515981 RepID=UPI00351AAE6C|nr:hypothetical protein FG386_000413 [Cryptosporidium ryanae]
MFETLNKGSVIADHVISSINLLRDYIFNYNKDVVQINNISHELMSLRRNWRELIVYLDELENNMNHDSAIKIKTLELLVNECWEKISIILNALNLSNIDSRPAFELFLRYRKEDICLDETNGLINLSDELLKNMEIDLKEKFELEAKLHEYTIEYTKMFYELEMLKRRTENLVQEIEPLYDKMVNIKNFILENQKDTENLRSYDVLIGLKNNLKPIYVFFNPIIIQNKRITNDENIMDMIVHGCGKISVLFNKPIINNIKENNYRYYSEFLSLFFPIKLEFSTLNLYNLTEAVTVTTFIHGDKLVKFHIFSDLLFEGDIGDFTSSIDSNFSEDEFADFNCGIPYYWIQFLINNKKVIPISIDDINIKINEIYKVIDLRIQNLTFFNFVIYLVSKSPSNLINFISEFLGNGKCNRKLICNLQGYDISKVHLTSEFSFFFTLESRKYEVSIDFIGNISYKIRRDRTTVQSSFTNNGGGFTDILRYNQDLSLNFCRDLIKLF